MRLAPRGEGNGRHPRSRTACRRRGGLRRRDRGLLHRAGTLGSPPFRPSLGAVPGLAPGRSDEARGEMMNAESHVLVVEDNTIISDLIKMVLAAGGYEVVSARNGLEAMALLR